jgi:hypothetical protein
MVTNFFQSSFNKPPLSDGNRTFSVTQKGMRGRPEMAIKNKGREKKKQ